MLIALIIDMDAIIEFKNITKIYGETIANDDVSCRVYPGTVHAFLGENGAGKSTLMKILSGCIRQDSGQLLISNKPRIFKTPREAQQHGIGMVHQNYSLLSSLTVSENIALSLRNGFIYSQQSFKKRIDDFIDKTQLSIKPSAFVWQLSQGEKQRVEIFKLLFLGARVIVLDEPTSSLTPQESDLVLSLMRRLAEDGHTVLFVTHKLSEVMKFTDVITILRNGKVVDTFRTDSVSESDLASLMVGHDEENNKIPKSWPVGKEVIKLSGVSLRNEHTKLALSDITFSVKSGEIFGVAGVAGNGQDELVDILVGHARHYNGKFCLTLTKNDNSKISYIPDDRFGVATAPSLSIEENLMLKNFDRPPFCRGIVLNREDMRKEASERIRNFRIKINSLSDTVWTLSGGNIQRLILARELTSNPDMIVAVNPTKGLDVSSAAYVNNTLMKQAASGVAVIIISENLDELLDMSHRVMVLFNGKSMGIFEPRNVTRQQIGLCMGGQKGFGLNIQAASYEKNN